MWMKPAIWNTGTGKSITHPPGENDIFDDFPEEPKFISVWWESMERKV
jgi:hypothetical protein